MLKAKIKDFIVRNFKVKQIFHLSSINFNIVLLLFAGLVLRILLSSIGTLQLDHGTFIAWGKSLAANGFPAFYTGWSDYLPGYLYVLFALVKLEAVINISPTLLYKLPAILADITTSFLIFKIVEKAKGERWALISSGLYLFNPAIFGNSTLWGQVDSLTALFSILAVYLAPVNFVLSAVTLALGTLVKPQAALAAIVVLFLMFRDKWRYEKIAGYTLVGAAVFILGFVPFTGQRNLSAFILERISATTNQYPYTSVNAFNFWGMLGMWRQDNIGAVTPQIIGYILTLASIAGYLILNIRQKRHSSPLFAYEFLSVCLLSMYAFFTRMHERHMLPALAPLAIAMAATPSLLMSYLALSAIYIANLRYAYVWITENFRSIFSNNSISGFSAATVLALAGIFSPLPKSIFRKIKWKDMQVNNKFDFPEIKLSKKTARIILGLILVFALISRIIFLDTPKNEYFDEVYHAFTARTLLHNDPKAWEWWNTPPEGFAYEWTHPPFAKLAMWGSMIVLGENSFAWRLPQAIAGTLTVFIVYLLAKEIFRDEATGLLTALVLSLDGLFLVMNRIGMNDSYFLLFALTSIYFFIKDKNVLSAVFLGLAGSSKWTALWVVPILLVAHFVFKKKGSELLPKIRWSYISFVIIPVVIYLASYIPFFTSGHTFQQFININALFGNCSSGIDCSYGVQQQMWWYHTHLDAEHAYSSNPLSWPLLLRPIYLYTSGIVNDTVSNIYAMGNPIVFWFGLVCVFIAGYFAITTKNKKLGFVVFSYFALFLPWAASPRIMFLYHYLPAVPFLSLSTAYVLRKWPKNIVAYFLVASLVFIYFFPHWTGIKIPRWLDSSYYWLDSWR